MAIIRKEQSGDTKQIRIVNNRAFGRTEEADLVDKLRQSCANRISLVAVSNDQIVGHILFTPVTIQAKERIITGMGLAPMAVLPESQYQGIGSQLVKAGLEVAEKAKYPFVIVLGHPTYYPRFGFVPASRYKIGCEYENIPDEAFMILVLSQETLDGVSGVAKYRPEFAAAI
jgi:putative acetyltransferase